jgi:pyruvate,orthophosphate dikinase
MQARAIFEAAISMTNQGIQVFPEIMVPLVGTPQACLLFEHVFLLM